MSAEHREYPRYAVEATVILEAAGQRIEGRSRNLSSGGMSAVMGGAIESGTQVSVRVTLVFSQDSISEPLDLPARVVWCTALDDDHQVGLQFVRLSDEQRSYLEMFLRFLEEDRRAAAPADDGDPFSS